MKFATSLLLLFSNVASATSLEPWDGHWRGTCQLIPAVQGISTFQMELQVGNTHTLPAAWTVIYENMGTQPRQVRAYEIQATTDSPHHFVINEKNGLLLDSYILGNTLYSAFVISGKVIPARYEITSSQTMTVEMPSFNAQPVRTTCVDGSPQLCAHSLAVQSVQRCELRKL